MHYAVIVFQLSGNYKPREVQEAIHFVLQMLKEQECITIPYQC